MGIWWLDGALAILVAANILWSDIMLFNPQLVV